MEKVTLSKLQMQQYIEIKEAFGESKIIGIPEDEQARLGDVLVLLIWEGYVHKLDIDNTNAYELLGNLSDFEMWHRDMKREERRLSAREWKIAIVSAVIGAAIGLIPSIVSWLK